MSGYKRVSKKAGMQPGSMVYVGLERRDPVHIDVVAFGVEEFREFRADSLESCLPSLDGQTTTWINISGVHEVDLVQRLGEHFKIHPLALEDVLNTAQRPKIERADDYVFAVLRMIYRRAGEEELTSEQVSILFGDRWLVTLQEQPGDVFEAVRERLRKGAPRVRFVHTDYLAYALMDAIVDSYFIILEAMGDTVEDVEDESLDHADETHLQAIRGLKRDLIVLRKSVWPLREVASGFERIEAPRVDDMTRPYIRDLYEHTVQIMDSVDTYREMVSGLLELYLSNQSHRLNEVMKVLTVIATIFIPLGFLAGVFGMNFDTDISPLNMPELKMRYGYPLFWLVALLVGGGLFWYFRRRRWI